MRNTLLSLAALMLLVAPGCGDSNNNTAADMAMTPADMTATPGDMTKYQTCMQILACAVNCGQNQTCAVSCATNAVPAAQLKFGALGQCVLGVCGPGDAGNHACTGSNDPSSTCATCIGTAGLASSQMGNICYPQYSDCASH